MQKRENNSRKRKFLVVSPHPDDAELGLGGTILKLKSKGHDVFMVDLTSGEPTPYGTQQKRRMETDQASKVLNIDKRINLGLPNRYLFDGKEERLLLAEQIRLHKPDIIFCPYPVDAHPDHVAASKITEGARFYAKYTNLTIKGDPHYPFYLFHYFCFHLRIVPEISFLVDISCQFQEKIKAVKCYKSQFIDNPKSKFVFDYIETQNKTLGRLIHAEYAEALYSREAIKIDDLSNLL